LKLFGSHRTVLHGATVFGAQRFLTKEQEEED